MFFEANVTNTKEKVTNKSFRRGEIWNVELSEAIGTGVITKYRPCLIVSNDFTNTNKANPVVTIVPISGSKDGNYISHVKIKHGVKNKLNRPSVAICENVFTVNKNHVRNCLGSITLDELKDVDEGLRLAMGL